MHSMLTADIVYIHDIRMLKSCSGLCLCAKFCHKIHILGEF